jgi:hypothetical protein
MFQVNGLPLMDGVQRDDSFRAEEITVVTVVAGPAHEAS